MVVRVDRFRNGIYIIAMYGDDGAFQFEKHMYLSDDAVLERARELAGPNGEIIWEA